MVDNSLIDNLSKRINIWESLSRFQYYDGTLEKVLDETEKSLNKNKKSTQDIAKLVFHPPRIIRAFIDYKIENSSREWSLNKTNESVYMSYIQDSINLALEIYSGKSTKDKVFELMEKLNNSSDKDLLYKQLFQGVDEVSLDAIHPYYSIKSLDILLNKFKGKDLLFISLAHGGISPGLDIFLRYQNETKNKNSVFYGVRFSNKKSQDSIPELIPQEINYLKNMSKNRNVVVFDEDVNTGRTMMLANNDFRNYIIKKEFYLLTNKGGIINNDSFVTSSNFAEYMSIINL